MKGSRQLLQTLAFAAMALTCSTTVWGQSGVWPWPSGLTFSYTGDQHLVTVYANKPNGPTSWQVDSGWPSWIQTVQPQSGGDGARCTITVAPNETGSQRSYTLGFHTSDGLYSGSLGITQLALTEPEASLGAGSALSTTRARVEGTVDARGSESEVRVVFEYGTDGVVFGNSVTATPGVVSGSGPVRVAATLTGLLQGTTYHYRIRASGPGGTGLSDLHTFTLSILSGIDQVFPVPPEVTTGAVTLTFDPAAIGAWRFAGEREWRTSGVPAEHLATGLRVIEYLPVPGYISPPEEELTEVENGVSLELQRSYFTTPGSGSGNLTVTLNPAEVVGEEGAEWRFLGETTWRDSGVPATGLVAGTYLVECQPLAGRVTPPVVTISLAADEQRELALTYYRSNNPVGDAPWPLTKFSDISTNKDLPYAYVGQIRSEVGSSTGFVVKLRVVATAGHVVFDDETLANVVGLEWFLQRHAGVHEPQPQVPRGYYLAAGYEQQRIADASPGEGSEASQDLDYAALYFPDEAGRGGYGGFLASELGDANEFLDSASDKILAGYAVDGVAMPADQGKLHATPVFTNALAPAYGETWTSSAVHGLGGCSGGPLFVRHANGSLYPAAIYLGGSNQTVVRAIDSDVVDLFLRAEWSGGGGGNNTSGGVTHTNAAALGSATQTGSITILIEPPEARALSEAGWWLDGPDRTTSLKKHGWRHSGLNEGTYNLNMTPLPGFEAPQPVQVDAETTVAHTYTYTYLVLKVETTSRTASGFTVTTAGKEGRVYTLETSRDLVGEPWSVVASEGPIGVDGKVILTDNNVSMDKGFYRIRVTKP